ncbi:MAG: T9SS type A sorting domain-containing protein, partial [Calditrichota bacterium]
DYVVYAINECGASLVSETADGHKIPGVGQVTMPWASRNYCGSINVSWLDNFDNEDGFRIYRDGAFLAEVAADVQSYTDAAIDPGSYHWYRIAAYNICGEGALSDSMEGYRWAVPPQVMTLTATRDSCTSISLTWSDLATESYYIIVRDGVNIDSTEADANDTTYRDEGLNPGLYDYAVYARNHCGDGLASDTVEGQVADVPGVVTNLQATTANCTTVTVTWDDLPDELNYELLRDGASLVVLGQNAVSYVDNPTIGTHAYAVIASNICGIGDTTDAVTGERQGPPTAMPVITVPDEACDTVHFCWTAATDITGYHIFRNGTHYADVTPEHLCWWDLNQGGNVRVGYKVQPYNECGDGPMSAADSVLFLPTVLQPTGLTATVTNCVTVTLHWNDNPNEEGYYVLRDNVQIAEVAQNVVDYIDSPANPGTYIYRVKAFNDCGSSPASDSAVGIRRGPPAMVTGVNASDTLCNQITITWNDVADEDSFQVQRNGDRIGMTIANVTTFNDMEAAPGSAYAYTVVAFNDCGMSTISAADSGHRATVPVQVTGVVATINRCDSVIVTWTDVATDSGYWIYRGGVQVGTRLRNATRYADAPAPGTYQYQVRAVNACGLGALSAEATGTRQAVPLAPVITAGPEQCMVVTIFPTSGGGDVDRFRIYRDTILIDSIDVSVESWQETIAGIHQYYFTAYNADCGTASAPSNTLQLTGHEPAFPPPSITFVEPARCDSIRLTWPDGSGEVEGYVIRRDGDSIATTTNNFYTDLGVDDTEDHVYAVASFNPWCGTGDFTQPVTGSILPLIEAQMDLPETLYCRATYTAYFDHCSGVEVDSMFLSLDGAPFEYVTHASPVADSIVFTVDSIENQIITPNCRAMVVAYRGSRADTIISDPFIIHCDLAAEELTGADIPRDFMLDQNYPNPFNPSTTVRFGVPKAAEVKIEIYNITGQHVATLLEGTYQPGWHKVVWDCAACPTGMYIMRMQTNEKVLMRKMLLMK